MQFEDLRKEIKLGLDDFRIFIKDRVENLDTQSQKDILKQMIPYFLLFRIDKMSFWKFVSSKRLVQIEKYFDKNELSFVFDLAARKNFWLKEK